eukprot:1106343-Heterocapsa_arctica.AAC.1
MEGHVYSFGAGTTLPCGDRSPELKECNAALIRCHRGSSCVQGKTQVNVPSTAAPLPSSQNSLVRALVEDPHIVRYAACTSQPSTW